LNDKPFNREGGFLLSLDEVLEEYLYHCLAKGYTPKTMKNKRQEYKQLNMFLKEKRAITTLEGITVHDLKAYIRLKQKDGLQPSSIKSVHKIIAAFFQWCIEEGYTKENLMKMVETPKQTKKIFKSFSTNEVYAMINVFGSKDFLEIRNQCIISMLADCGLRSIEIRGLKTVNVRESSILVNGKGGKDRIIFISPALKKVLIKYERIRKQYMSDKLMKSDYYFITYQGANLSNVALYNVIKEAGERAGVEDVRVSPHTFRHFFSVQCILNGVDIYTLSKLLGHSTVNTTEQYLRSLEDFELIKKAMPSSPLMNIGNVGLKTKRKGRVK
jgi:integrase/recombinase XerD